MLLKTGWPPRLMQDDCKGLSKWLSNRIDSRLRARQAAEQIRKELNMKIAFNTGSHYTEHGQRIAAWIVDDPKGWSRVLFVDFDRGIRESFPYNRGNSLGTAQDLARHVMYVYDHGQYRVDSQSFEFSNMLSDVSRNGYDAFISDPEVVVVTYRR